VSLKTFALVVVSIFAVLAVACFTQLSVFDLLGYALWFLVPGVIFAIPFALFRLLWRAGTKLGGR
jgi:hypothetical protein